MHNMALCFQKMGALEECSLCLDACLSQLQSPYINRLFKSDPPRKLKRLKYECKIHMQVCALLSQLNRHQEALCHAKRSVQIAQYMIHDLMELCEMLNQKIAQAKKREQVAQDLISKGDVDTPLSKLLPGLTDGNEHLREAAENKFSKSDLIYFDEQVSMLERTASKFYPIIQEAAKRMVRHKEDYVVPSENQDNKQKQAKPRPHDESEIKSIDDESELQNKDPNNRNPYQSPWIIKKSKELRAQEKDKTLANSINMKVLLGYLNQNEWMYLLNIGNIMQITPLTIHDLHSSSSIEIELARDSIIEKISYLAVSYFCVSTELRFLVNLKDNPNVDPVQVRAESEFWHGKALEISCTFLPSESPLVSHIYSSYKKHHAPVNQVIAEEPSPDQDMDDGTHQGHKTSKNSKTPKSKPQEKSQHQDPLGLRVIRPLAGIDQSKHSPMVRANQNMNIALSPLNMSPSNYLKKQEQQQQDNASKKNDKATAVIKILDQESLSKKTEKPGKAQQQQVKGKENQAKRGNVNKTNDQTSQPRDKQMPQRQNQKEQKRDTAQNNTKDRLMELLWQEDNQDDSFIFRDDDEGGDENDERLGGPPGRANQLDDDSQNLAMSEDSPPNAKDQFERNEDPLNCITTLNFKNALNSVGDGGDNNENKKEMNIQIPKIGNHHGEAQVRILTKDNNSNSIKNEKPNRRGFDKDEVKFIEDRESNQENAKNETIKHMLKLEQIADLSSIMKEKNDIDDTTEDLRSMVDQQLVDKNFETNHTIGTNLGVNKFVNYNSNSFMKSEAKFEDNIGHASSIPNNEQHEIPILKKQSKDQPNNRTSSHNKFLKDTPIDQEMLTKNQMAKSINATKTGSNKQNDASNKDHFQSQNPPSQYQLQNNKGAAVKSRPKTSENATRPNPNNNTEQANKFKGSNQMISKDSKSSTDQYEKVIRPNTNQVNYSSVNVGGGANRAAAGSPLRQQLSVADNLNQQHFASSNEANLNEANSQQQRQAQQAAGGSRAFTQQHFYNQAISAQRTTSQSPPRKQSTKSHNSKKGTNNDLSVHNDIMNGGNSQQVLTSDQLQQYRFDDDQLRYQNPHILIANNAVVQQHLQSVASDSGKQGKSQKLLQQNPSLRNVNNDGHSKSQGRTKARNNKDYASPSSNPLGVGGGQKLHSSVTAKTSPQHASSSNTHHVQQQQRPRTGGGLTHPKQSLQTNSLERDQSQQDPNNTRLTQGSRYKQKGNNNVNKRVDEQTSGMIEQIALPRSVQTAVGTSRAGTARNHHEQHQQHQFNTTSVTIDESGSQKVAMKPANANISFQPQMKRNEDSLTQIQNQNYVKPKSPGGNAGQKASREKLALAPEDISYSTSNQGQMAAQRKFQEGKQSQHGSSSRERQNDRNHQQQTISSHAKMQFQAAKQAQPKFSQPSSQNQTLSSKNLGKHGQQQRTATNSEERAIENSHQQHSTISSGRPDHQQQPDLHQQAKKSNLEIQTHLLSLQQQQQIKIKSARTSVQTPTGTRGGQTSTKNRDLIVNMNQRIQQAEIERSASGGSAARGPGNNIAAAFQSQQTPHSLMASSHVNSASKPVTNDSRTTLKNQQQYILQQQLVHLQNLQNLQQMHKNSSQQQLSSAGAKMKVAQAQQQSSSSGKKPSVNKTNRYVAMQTQSQQQFSNAPNTQQQAQVQVNNSQLSEIASRGGSAKAQAKYSSGKQSNSQTRATAAAPRYNLNKNIEAISTSMQAINNRKKDQQAKSRNAGQNLGIGSQLVCKTTSGVPSQQNYASGSGAGGGAMSHRNQVLQTNQTFTDDISNMRNMQMQIQSKLNTLQKFKKDQPGQQKVIKNAKSAGKIHQNYPQQAAKLNDQLQQHFDSAHQSAQTSQRSGISGKIQLNMKGVAGNVISHPAAHGGQMAQMRSGALQTVRNKDHKKDQLMQEDAGNFNLQNLQTHGNGNLKTYNHNSLETSLDGDAALAALGSMRGGALAGQNLQLQYPMTAIGTSLAFPSTPNVQSARGSVPTSSHPQINFTNKHASSQNERGQPGTRQSNSQKRPQNHNDSQKQLQSANQPQHQPTIGIAGKPQRGVGIKKGSAPNMNAASMPQASNNLRQYS